MAKNWKTVCKKIFTKDQELEQAHQEFHSTHRLLLLGTKESGKTTIIKHMRILYGCGYTTAERLSFVPDIRRNVKTAISELVRAFITLEEVFQLDNCEHQEWLEYICDMNGFMLTDEGLEVFAGSNGHKGDQSAQYPEEFWIATDALWTNSAVRKLCHRRSEFCLPDSAEYFLNRLSDIRKPSYIPTDQDILRVRVETTKSMETSFTVDNVRYNIFDVAGQRDQKGKWLRCFNNINTIIFVLPTSAFDLPPIDEDCAQNNRLAESLATFSMLWNSKWLTRKTVIVFLNKVDQLQEKIAARRDCFDKAFLEFKNYSTPSFAIHSNGEASDFIRAKYFIRHELTKITSASNTQHMCYPHFTSAVDSTNMEKVFNDCREIIQRTQLQQVTAV